MSIQAQNVNTETQAVWNIRSDGTWKMKNNYTNSAPEMLKNSVDHRKQFERLQVEQMDEIQMQTHNTNAQRIYNETIAYSQGNGKPPQSIDQNTLNIARMGFSSSWEHIDNHIAKYLPDQTQRELAKQEFLQKFSEISAKFNTLTPQLQEASSSKEKREQIVGGVVEEEMHSMHALFNKYRIPTPPQLEQYLKQEANIIAQTKAQFRYNPTQEYPSAKNGFNFPHPQSEDLETFTTADQYIRSLSGHIFYHFDDENYKYLAEKDAVFYSALQKGFQNKPLSPEEYQILVQKANDPSNRERKEKLQKNIDGMIQKENKRSQGGDSSKSFIDDISRLMTPKTSKGMDNFQLAMANIASSIIAKNPNITGNIPKTQLEQQATGNGHFVPGPNMNLGLNVLNATGAGLITPGSLFFEFVVAGGAAATFVGNALAASKEESFVDGMIARAPILGAAAFAYAYPRELLYNGTWHKMMNPNDMPGGIMREAFRSKSYIQYFRNPWEVSFANQIVIPDKKTFSNALKKIEEESIKTPDGKLKTKRDGFEKDEQGKPMGSREKKALRKNLCVDHFRDGGHLAFMMPHEFYRTPDGRTLPKNEFLNELDTKGADNKVRYEVMKIMMGRLRVQNGVSVVEKDNPLAHLNALHIIAQNNSDAKLEEMSRQST